MKFLIVSTMMIFSFSIFAVEQDPMYDDFYFGADHFAKCKELGEKEKGKTHLDINRCMNTMSKVHITRQPVIYEKIYKKCFYITDSDNYIVKLRDDEPTSCLKAWDGVVFPKEAETTCANLQLNTCKDLYANSLKKYPLESDKKLMEKLKVAVDAGNLDLARNLINTIQRKKEVPVCKNPVQLGQEVADTHMQKLNEDVNKAVEKTSNAIAK